jgi:methionyl-tRNA formyltransferase
MKTVFFGSPDFAIPVASLLKNLPNINLIKVVTTSNSAIKKWAAENQLELLSLSDYLVNLKSRPDIQIVAAYGKFLPPEIIFLPKYKTLNLHPSLLPLLRGPSPIKTAILEGHQSIGISIMEMDHKMDHGPILAQIKVPLYGQETFAQLAPKLFTLGAVLLDQVLPLWKNYCENVKTAGKTKRLKVNGLEASVFLPPKIQAHSQATYTPKLTRESGHIDWNQPPITIDRMVKALNPWPGAWTNLSALCPSKNPNLPEKNVKLLETFIDKNGILVIKKLQVEGKTPTSWEEFKMGYFRK